MSLPLQVVRDPATQQNFDAISRKFSPIPVTITGKRNDPELALKNLLAGLKAAGLIIDSTTASWYQRINRRLTNIRRLQNQPQPQPSYQTPYSASADTSIAGLNQNYGDTNANIDYQQQQAKQQYGLDPGYNDPSTNPYSKAALLENSYHNAQQGNTNNYASRGQLYSGALTNAQNTASGSYLQNRNTLQQ